MLAVVLRLRLLSRGFVCRRTGCIGMQPLGAVREFDAGPDMVPACGNAFLGMPLL